MSKYISIYEQIHFNIETNTFKHWAALTGADKKVAL